MRAVGLRLSFDLFGNLSIAHSLEINRDVSALCLFLVLALGLSTRAEHEGIPVIQLEIRLVYGFNSPPGNAATALASGRARQVNTIAGGAID